MGGSTPGWEALIRQTAVGVSGLRGEIWSRYPVERSLGTRSDYAQSYAVREGTKESQALSEQGVPLIKFLTYHGQPAPHVARGRMLARPLHAVRAVALPVIAMAQMNRSPMNRGTPASYQDRQAPTIVACVARTRMGLERCAWRTLPAMQGIFGSGASASTGPGGCAPLEGADVASESGAGIAPDVIVD